MSRAFVFEKEEMFHCAIKNKDCPHANLRGDCEMAHCKDDDANITPEEKKHNNKTAENK